jgi:hypothetical protein
MVEQEWILCRSEIKWLLSNVEQANQEDRDKVERLTSILYDRSEYDFNSVRLALTNLDVKSLMKIDSFERSLYCGVRSGYRMDD